MSNQEEHIFEKIEPVLTPEEQEKKEAIDAQATIEELKDTIEELNDNIEVSNSLKGTFVRGIVRGVATALGAIVVTAVILAILAQFFTTAKEYPYLDKLIHSLQLDKVFQTTGQ